MNKESYEELLAEAKAKAIEQIAYHTTPEGISYILGVFAIRVAAISRDYQLANLTTADELAEKRGVTNRSVQRLAKRRHDRYGTGRMIGNKWVFAVDEIELLEADLRQGSTVLPIFSD